MSDFADCQYWYGLNFPGLDVPPWLPFMAGDAIDQPGKLTQDLPSDSRTLEADEPREAA